MAYEITTLRNQNIVIVTLSGVLDARAVVKATVEHVRSLSERPDHVVRIIDVRRMDASSASTTLQLIEDIRRAITLDNDPCIRTYVVGAPRLLEIVQYGGMRVYSFSNLESAVEQARAEIANRLFSEEFSVGRNMNNKQAGRYAHA